MRVELYDKPKENQYYKLYKNVDNNGNIILSRPILLNDNNCTVLSKSDLGLYGNTKHFITLKKGENPDITGYTIIEYLGKCKDTEHYEMHIIKEVGKAYGNDELV